MKAIIVKVGNSKGVRIPKELLIKSGLERDVELSAKPGEIRIIRVRQTAPAVNEEALLSEATLSDWLSPEEDEAWKSLQSAV